MTGRARAAFRAPSITGLGLAALTALAWAAFLASMMSPLGVLMMPMDAMWSVATLGAVGVMWTLMMAAMMLPSAAPMIMTYSALSRRREDQPGGTAVFVGAYLLVWVGFSIIATALHWGLQAAGVLSPVGSSTSQLLSGVLLLMAGSYQLTPLKRTCLRHCRTPLGFLMTEWRQGPGGAFVMGFRHGFYCLGCCWALMVLLFAFGVMSLPWVGVLAVTIATEKIVPGGEHLSQGLGLVLMALGMGQVAIGIGG